MVVSFVFLTRRQEEAALYQSIKEARLMAQKAEEERTRLEEEENKKMQVMYNTCLL